MELIFESIVFLAGIFLIHYVSSRVVVILSQIAKFFQVKEFIVAFFLMAMAASLPNFFLGVNSALEGKPEISFGDVLGGNVIDLTLVVALAVLLSNRNLPVRGVLVQQTIIFSTFTASLPVLLSFDGVLSRADGIILLSLFAFYTYWIFSKKERFKETYDGINGMAGMSLVDQIKLIFRDVGLLFLYVILMILASKIIVDSTIEIANILGVSLLSMGILVIAIGNAMPELYFSVIAARKGKSDIIIGDLIGAVIIPATLILGLVLLIHPIYLNGGTSFFLARIFMVLVAVFFLIGSLTGRVVTKKEAIFLLSVYFLFVIIEVIR